MTMPTLVLIPGLMCDQAVWAPQCGPLSACAAVHVAAHGLAADLGQMAEQILAAVSGPLALAGHSMGGRVALEVARRAPQRLRGLALLDTGYRALAAGAAGERERNGRLAVIEQAQREGLGAAAAAWLRGMVHPSRLEDAALRESIVAMWQRHSLEQLRAQMQALLARPDAAGVLAGIRVPALVLCGAEDLSAPVSQHREISALISGSEFIEVPGCGHMCTLERPAQVTAALVAWQKRL